MLALTLASVIALMIAGSVTLVMLVSIVVLTTLMVALLYRVGSPHRHMVLKTTGLIYACAIAMELIFLAFKLGIAA